MKAYKLKFKHWYVSANNADEAKRKAMAIYRKNAEVLIDVEIAKPKERAPLWSLLLFGK